MDLEHVLKHDCTPWRASSQKAATLYAQGVKLWSKADFISLEQQLAAHATQATFRVRSIDGSVLSIQNPMVSVPSPIWQPRASFRDYWRLVRDQPVEPEETYLCSYLPTWINMTARSFRGVITNPDVAFDEARLQWLHSDSCALLRSWSEQTAAFQRVKKILCLGLGDFCRKMPEWAKSQLGGDDDAEMKILRGPMTQHAIALTFAQLCSERTGKSVPLFAQDPAYTDEAKVILANHGFSVVGDYGAGGFAEMDDETLVFSAYINVPLKQIIADIARPPILVSTGFSAFHDSEKPYQDADSPRTVEMWKEYKEKEQFPVSAENKELASKFKDIFIYVKQDIN